MIPTFEAWRLTAITNILNRFILYLPNVFAAVVIGFAGIIVANIASEAITGMQANISKRTSGLLATITRFVIIFFAAIMALNQLGISPNLIQIVLTGFVAAFAIAIGLGVGLSIGLGGRDTVRNTLDGLAGNNNLIGAKGGMAKKSMKNNGQKEKNTKNK